MKKNHPKTYRNIIKPARLLNRENKKNNVFSSFDSKGPPDFPQNNQKRKQKNETNLNTMRSQTYTTGKLTAILAASFSKSFKSSEDSIEFT